MHAVGVYKYHTVSRLDQQGKYYFEFVIQDSNCVTAHPDIMVN